MRWMLLLLGLIGCSSAFADTTRIEGTGSDALEFRVVNRNWASATVRLMARDGRSIKLRLGRVEGLGKETFRLRRGYSGGFRVHVQFLAGSSLSWLDPEVYYGSEDCIELVIQVYSPGSYTVLCFRN